MTRPRQSYGEAAPVGSRWAEAWPDALAFAVGLAVAWYFRWETRDLVWSLWLSSLVMGYAMIVWTIFSPALYAGGAALQDRTITVNGKEVSLASGAYVVIGLFLLAFFTFHFGMFHFVHSVFLAMFFPLDAGGPKMTPGLGFYGEVFQRYWWFLPAAAIAERTAFRLKPPEPAGPPDTAVTVEAIAARKKRNARNNGFTGMMAPYKNVVRLHLLIFFFAAAHFAQLDSFLVYAVVYAVYFFPWRLLRGKEAA